MTQLTARVDRLVTRRPSLIPEPRREFDLGRLTPVQQIDLDRLNRRCTEVGIAGLTDVELEECAVLVGILEAQTAA